MTQASEDVISHSPRLFPETANAERPVRGRPVLFETCCSRAGHHIQAGALVWNGGSGEPVGPGADSRSCRIDATLSVTVSGEDGLAAPTLMRIGTA